MDSVGARAAAKTGAVNSVTSATVSPDSDAPVSVNAGMVGVVAPNAVTRAVRGGAVNTMAATRRFDSIGVGCCGDDLARGESAIRIPLDDRIAGSSAGRRNNPVQPECARRGDGRPGHGEVGRRSRKS